MKLIMAVSADGYVARKKGDDMSWTGPSDKAAFRLLTCVGGTPTSTFIGPICASTLACGPKTYELVPKTLAGRRLMRLSSRPRSTDPEDLNDLAWYNRHYPTGWLIGGQTIALAALEQDLVDQAFICASGRRCFPDGDGERYTLDLKHLREEYARHDPKWEKSLTIKFGDVDVQVWNRLR